MRFECEVMNNVLFMPVFPYREGCFVLLLAFMAIYNTWWCVDRFVNFIMQSWLLGKSFDGFIFGDNLRLCSNLVPEH